MNILYIGDIVGKPGRRVLSMYLDQLRDEYHLDLIVANAENLAAGFGITPELADKLLEGGVDVLTSGNHVWDKREVYDYIEDEPRLLRPHNYPNSTPGRGWTVVTASNGEQVGVVNVMGNVFMHPNLDCPFAAVEDVFKSKPEDVMVMVVDFHAEASSEKVAMGWYLDGRASAVVGSHTHTPSADERLLRNGTAFISDVGMTGCYDSIIGMDIEKSLRRFVDKTPERLEVATGKGTLCGVVLTIDPASGRASAIERISRVEK